MSINPPPNPDKPLTNQRPQAPLGVPVVAFALLNLLGMPLGAAIIDGGGEGLFWLIAIGLGCMVAQFGVLPAWLVWGARPFWQRLLLHWALAALLYGCWVVGMAMALSSHGPPMPRDFLLAVAGIFLLLPAISLGIEAPLWLTRLVFGWRFRCQAEIDHERPLAIRDFLMGMAVISVALAAARAATALASSSQASQVWIPIAVSVAVGMPLSAAILLPLAWWTMRLEDAKQGLGIVAAYAGVASIILAGIAGSLLLGGSGDLTPLIAIFLVVGSMIAALAAALSLARSAGYRLEVGKRRAE